MFIPKDRSAQKAKWADWIAQKLIADYGVDPVDARDPSKTMNDLALDSLDGIDIIMDLENQANIEIPNDTSETFKTLGDVIEFLAVAAD